MPEEWLLLVTAKDVTPEVLAIEGPLVRDRIRTDIVESLTELGYTPEWSADSGVICVRLTDYKKG